MIRYPCFSPSAREKSTKKTAGESGSICWKSSLREADGFIRQPLYRIRIYPFVIYVNLWLWKRNETSIPRHTERCQLMRTGTSSGVLIPGTRVGLLIVNRKSRADSLADT